MKKEDFADGRDLHIPQVHSLALCSSNQNQDSLQPLLFYVKMSIYIHSKCILKFSFTLAMARFSLTCTQRYSKATGSRLKRSMGSFGTKLILKRHLILCELGLWVTQDSAIIMLELGNPGWATGSIVLGNVTLLQSLWQQEKQFCPKKGFVMGQLLQ